VAFTYTLSTDNGKLRLRIGDTGGVVPGDVATSGYAFDDAELAQFLTDGGTVDAAAIRAIDTLLVSKATRAKKFQVPGLTYDDTAALAELRAVRATLAADGGALPAMSLACISASATGAADITELP